jgi:hypothetical protein
LRPVSLKPAWQLVVVLDAVFSYPFFFDAFFSQGKTANGSQIADYVLTRADLEIRTMTIIAKSVPPSAGACLSFRSLI